MPAWIWLIVAAPMLVAIGLVAASYLLSRGRSAFLTTAVIVVSAWLFATMIAWYAAVAGHPTPVSVHVENRGSLPVTIETRAGSERALAGGSADVIASTGETEIQVGDLLVTYSFGNEGRPDSITVTVLQAETDAVDEQ